MRTVDVMLDLGFERLVVAVEQGLPQVGVLADDEGIVRTRSRLAAEDDPGEPGQRLPQGDGDVVARDGAQLAMKGDVQGADGSLVLERSPLRHALDDGVEPERGPGVRGQSGGHLADDDLFDGGADLADLEDALPVHLGTQTLRCSEVTTIP